MYNTKTAQDKRTLTQNCDLVFKSPNSKDYQIILKLSSQKVLKFYSKGLHITSFIWEKSCQEL